MLSLEIHTMEFQLPALQPQDLGIVLLLQKFPKLISKLCNWELLTLGRVSWKAG